MKLSTAYKQSIVTIIALLYILLFVYAAVSKLLDFENFRIQLGQSPLLTAFASWVSWLTPMVELLIAVLLIFKKSRLMGLFSSTVLMSMFTVYIFLILNYSDYVPCSCGGVLEKLGWTEHLIFNIVFTILGLLGVLLIDKRKIFLVLFSIIGGMTVVIALFLVSEDIVHYQNNFTRRFPPHPIKKTGEFDLGYNSYYLAGVDSRTLYLGNKTAPLHLLAIDTSMRDTSHIRIKIAPKSLPFKSVHVFVVPPFFYVADGSVPCIYRGHIGQWEGALIMKGQAYFSLLVPLDSTSFAFRAASAGTGENVLGLLTIQDSSLVQLHGNILEKQIDGVFCTDGMLIRNKELKRIIYTYYYRNQFISTDHGYTSIQRQNTIDTNAHAKLKLITSNGGETTRLASPPLKVNKSTSSFGNHMYINSAIMGRHEAKELWGQASIIDVYDISDKSYRFSFYIDHQNGHKLRAFFVHKNVIYALIGTKLIKYEIKKRYRPFSGKNMEHPDVLQGG